MTVPEAIHICRWLIGDTFRQAVANRVFWVMLAACGVVLLFCAGVSVEGGESLKPTDDFALDRPHGTLVLAFGAWRVPLFRDGEAMIHFILLVLGEGIFGVLGTLFALVFTAGFIPEFFQGTPTVLLSKPTPRWVLLLGKYLGVMAVLAFQIGLFVFGSYLILGLRTGYWVTSYLWGMPLLLLQVGTLYSFSTFLAVCTGSAVACVFGSVLFWFMCWGMNLGRHVLLVEQAAAPTGQAGLSGLAEVGYWILPKPLDLVMILHNVVGSGQTIPQLQAVQRIGAFHPDLIVLSSLAFVVVMIGLAGQQLASRDL